MYFTVNFLTLLLHLHSFSSAKTFLFFVNTFTKINPIIEIVRVILKAFREMLDGLTRLYRH